MPCTEVILCTNIRQLNSEWGKKVWDNFLDILFCIRISLNLLSLENESKQCYTQTMSLTLRRFLDVCCLHLDIQPMCQPLKRNQIRYPNTLRDCRRMPRDHCLELGPNGLPQWSSNQCTIAIYKTPLITLSLFKC